VNVAVVNEISFSVAPGEFFTLLVPPAADKTTTLRLLAGLETRMRLRSRSRAAACTLAGRGCGVPIDKRGMGMVFQSYAIWPH